MEILYISPANIEAMIYLSQILFSEGEYRFVKKLSSSLGAHQDLPFEIKQAVRIWNAS
jgi:hypothetical protein